MKKKSILFFFVGLLTVSILIFQACKKETKDDPPESNKVPETTKVIDNQVWQSNLIGIDSSDFTLYFNKNLATELPLEAGDFIVSADGYGLLRKINKISESADGLVVETGFASLTDVVNEGQTSFGSMLSTQKIMKINYHREGVVLDTSFIKSTEDTQLEYGIDVFLDPEQKIHVQGNFSILTELNGQLEIGYIPPRISLFELTYDIEQNLDFSTTIELVDLSYDHEVELASVYFQPIIALISGVPVVLVPELEIAVGVDAMVSCEVNTGVVQGMDYTVGLKYQDREWNTINDFNRSFNYTPPQLNCNAEARAYIKPQLNVLIYGIVSPYLYADLGGRIEADMQSVPWWSFYADANLGVGVEAEILGKEIFDFNTNPPLISFEQLIASSSDSDLPNAIFYANSTSGTAPLTVNFIDQSTNTPTAWQWDFGDGNTSAEQNPVHIYNANGSYTVSLTATNNYGSGTESKVDYIVVSGGGGNTPPTALFSVSPLSGTTSTNFAFDASGSTDIDDPTSQLQVRWDFDGDGSWDTEWSVEKTENHQFGIENTYVVKLEVKDTQGLTGQYTNSVTVNNGGPGTFTDPRDGKTYATIGIGGQIWFAENLNYVTANSWTYNNELGNGDVYGRLYTWDAAYIACPDGWHLPSDAEWKTLEMALGMTQNEADATDWRGTNEGQEMKEAGTTHWAPPNTGATNNFGFTALPGGVRYNDETFSRLTYWSYWWSSSEYSDIHAWYRSLRSDYDQVNRSGYDKTSGFSVRCVKD